MDSIVSPAFVQLVAYGIPNVCQTKLALKVSVLIRAKFCNAVQMPFVKHQDTGPCVSAQEDFNEMLALVGVERRSVIMTTIALRTDVATTRDSALTHVRS